MCTNDPVWELQCMLETKKKNRRSVAMVLINSMAVKFNDGIILGADSRTTTGAFIANR
jgi:20S proteasome alpha/beta subunit